MTTTPPSSDVTSAADRMLFCAASCDLNHAAVPHPPWDCNAPDDAPTLTAAQRAAVPDGELPWVQHATPLVLSAGEVDRLRHPISSAMHALEVDELDQVMDEAAGRLHDLIRRRDAATPGYLVGSKFFGKTTDELLDWSFATLERQQHRPTARTEPAISASLQLTDRDRAHLREEAAHRRQTITQAVRQWPTGRGGPGER